MRRCVTRRNTAQNSIPNLVHCQWGGGGAWGSPRKLSFLASKLFIRSFSELLERIRLLVRGIFDLNRCFLVIGFGQLLVKEGRKEGRKEGKDEHHDVMKKCFRMHGCTA